MIDQHHQAASSATFGLSFPRVLSASLSGVVREVQSYLRSYAAPVSHQDIMTSAVAGSSIVWKSTHASAFELQKYAWDKLAVLRSARQALPSSEALRSLESVINTFVAEDGPTPQMGSTVSGSVELQWLVNGTLVSAMFETSGEYNIFAADAHNEILLDEDVPFGESTNEVLGGKLRSLLAEMGASVTVRPPAFR
jgi:hypothetical protein